MEKEEEEEEIRNDEKWQGNEKQTNKHLCLQMFVGVAGGSNPWPLENGLPSGPVVTVSRREGEFRTLFEFLLEILHHWVFCLMT